MWTVQSTLMVARATALVPARGRLSPAVSCPALQMQNRGRSVRSARAPAPRHCSGCSAVHAQVHGLPAVEWDDAVRRSDRLAVCMCALQTRFCEGDYYVWLYRDEAGVPTSWERYSVTRAATVDSTITIEMATKFARDDNFFTHHRMIVNLHQQVLAEESRDGWRIGFEYLDEDGKWAANGTGDNVQAFEEKFDVFEMLSGVRARETREAKVRARLLKTACTRERARARAAPDEGSGAADQ